MERSPPPIVSPPEKMEDTMKTEKEKANEMLKERERARKGFAVTNDEGQDPLANPQDRKERRRRSATPVSPSISG